MVVVPTIFKSNHRECPCLLEVLEEGGSKTPEELVFFFWVLGNVNVSLSLVTMSSSSAPAWPRKAAPAALLSPGRDWPRPLSMVNVRPGSAQPLIGSSRVIPGLSLVAHHLSCCFTRPKQGQFKSHSSVGYRLLDRWHVTVAALKSWRPRSLCRITTSTPDPALWGPT